MKISDEEMKQVYEELKWEKKKDDEYIENREKKKKC